MNASTLPFGSAVEAHEVLQPPAAETAGREVASTLPIAPQTWPVPGSDSALIRAVAAQFSRSSSNRKLWSTASIPLLVAALAVIPALWVAAKLRMAGEGMPGAVAVHHWADVLSTAAYVAIGLGALLSWFLAAVLYRDVVKVVNDLFGTIYDVLAGNTGVQIPYTDRPDEYGQIARALDGLRLKMAEAAKHADQRWTITEAREQERGSLVHTFEQSLSDVVSSVASAASQLHSTASVLAAGTEQTREQTDVLSRAVQETASSTTAAAAASDEFAMSIGEISRQAGSSADLARRACEAAANADEKISQLSTAAGEIGQIVGLIQSIAQRTNLLALNASIEAARGGEAGRGFAVVASEVKELAAQTSRATERVAQQIADIQDSTGQSVRALQSIGDQVKELEMTAISIASAVDQQSVAGRDLARSLDMAARATDDVSDNIMQVRDATRNTGIAASQVLQSADELERQAGALRSKATGLVQQFRTGGT